ncbi:Replication protein A DNA-binding subunit B [Zea mays]|uniref:Replication protein A DNA-binding subunit B n=1 Tax=Zea mays TaxID=4577 RepID=A0A3L6E487_MAIZE|nr:Replication protein A DNA-binding subunit B [Zea mays]
MLTSSLTLNTYSLDKCSCPSFAFTLQMAEVLIGSLMIGNYSDRLCVRVSRMWEFYDPQDESKLLHADMVLIDEEGGSAHAQIYPPLAVVFKPMIKEGNVYNVSYVQIKKANRMYKPVDNDIMIGFTKWTTIEELIEVPPAFPEIVYSLTPFDQLTTLVDIREYFIDVIGAVTMISDVATIRTKMRQTQTAKRSVTIQHESCTPLEDVLWGEQATSFPADQISIAGQDSLQIIIFVGTLARSYAGTTSLTGGSSCKWYVNPQVPEATSLAARKCLKKTKPHGDAYKCSDSGCGHVGPPNPRYRFLITAGDETGETDFILFGRMAQRIVKKPLDILIADNLAGFIPDEITKLMEKVYTFNVSFTDSTIALGNVCFQVNTVVAEIGDGGQVPISPSGSQPSSISSARAASKSTSVDSVPTGGTSSQTPQSTKNYSKDKRARSPTPLSKGGSSATRQVARKILGGSTDKTGDGHDLAFGIADSRKAGLVMELPIAFSVNKTNMFGILAYRDIPSE